MYQDYKTEMDRRAKRYYQKHKHHYKHNHHHMHSTTHTRTTVPSNVGIHRLTCTVGHVLTYNTQCTHIYKITHDSRIKTCIKCNYIKKEI